MGISIRSANLKRDRPLLVGFLQEFLAHQANEHRFDWLYLENPHGPARAWAAIDEANGTLVGVAAAFPRRVCAAENTVLGYVLGDFCVHPGFRSLGPALQLQRACLEMMESALPPLGYDFPSKTMVAVYRRLGAEPRECMLRLAKPLRVDRQIASRVRSRLVARGLKALGNRALNWRSTRPSTGRSEEIALHDGPCGEEFTILAAHLRNGDQLSVERTAEYLNWRFLAHPSERFEFLTARRKKVLAAYLIFAHTGEDARIVDLRGMDDTELLRNLVLQAVEILRRRGVMTVSVSILAWHSYVKLFENLGFRRRESCPVVLFPTVSASPGTGTSHADRWFLMDGDRES
jgi:GNAT superfamily N-acetyltransferase